MILTHIHLYESSFCSVFFVIRHTCFTKEVFFVYWPDQVYVKEYMYTIIDRPTFDKNHVQPCLHKLLWTQKYIIRHFIGESKKVIVSLLESSLWYKYHLPVKTSLVSSVACVHELFWLTLCILLSHLDKTICSICVVLRCTPCAIGSIKCNLIHGI